MAKPNLMFEGLPVREAKRGLKLKPIQEDQKRARRGNPSCCVAAECVKRSFSVDEVRIYRSRALIKPAGKNHWVRYELPYNLSTEALIFDRGGDFKGKEFILKPMRPSLMTAVKKVVNARAAASGRGRVSNRDGSRSKRVKSVMAKLRGSPHFQHAAA